MQPRESKKDRRKCMLRNCNHTREFYEPDRKVGVCRKCKLIYFNKKDLKKIVDSQEVEQTITSISKLLEMIRIHAELHDIELIFEGFLSSLSQYEAKFNDLNLKFKEAFDKNLFEDFTKINEKLLGKHLNNLGWCKIDFIN